MERSELQRWQDGLRTAANRGKPFFLRSGEDRTSALPFSLWASGATEATIPASGAGEVDPDARLWWCAVSRDARAALECVDGARSARTAHDEGALFAQGRYTAIEVWTEAELSSLQALWWLGRMPGGAPLRGRMLDAARWHLENTQPDNATNRPWAIPVFLDLAVSDFSPDARLFAETLLHNTLAGNAEPEPFSALILRDAADAVNAMLREA